MIPAIVTVWKTYGSPLMLQQPFNRLILLQLLHIRDALCRSNTQDTGFYKDILINGIEDEYLYLYDEIAVNDATISKEIAQEVKDIIHMFQIVQDSVASLDETSKDKLSTSHFLSFNGFKPTPPEHKHFIYMKFFIKYYLDKAFIISPKDSLQLNEYREMLHRFKPFKQQSQLTYEQLQQVCVHKRLIQKFTYQDETQILTS